MTGQIRGQAGAREDDVGAVRNGRADQIPETRQGDHDVHADDAFCLFSGFLYLAGQSADIGAERVFGHVRLEHADHGAGYNADAAFVGHSRGQAGQGYTNAHAALNNGRRGGEFSDFKRRKHAFLLVWERVLWPFRGPLRRLMPGS